VLVCWDQWFPEGARLTALSGAQMLFYPTAIGWLAGEQEAMNLAQHQAWETIQRAHAIANGVYVVAVNRVGREGQLTFWGQSFVADPFGRIVAKASSDREETLVVELDLRRIEETRQNWPFLRDRRIDMYDGLSQRLLDTSR
jgi:N-carbamoylputrescine amidase